MVRAYTSRRTTEHTPDSTTTRRSSKTLISSARRRSSARASCRSIWRAFLSCCTASNAVFIMQCSSWMERSSLLSLSRSHSRSWILCLASSCAIAQACRSEATLDSNPAGVRWRDVQSLSWLPAACLASTNYARPQCPCTGRLGEQHSLPGAALQVSLAGCLSSLMLHLALRAPFPLQF